MVNDKLEQGGRRQTRAKRKRRVFLQESSTGFWPELCGRIEKGQVIPIISNSVINDQIFDIDGDGLIGVGPAVDGLAPFEQSIQEQLAGKWAKDINFPLLEGNLISRVAHFHRVVESSDDLAAKENYLDWLKQFLLEIAQDDGDVDLDEIDEMWDEVGNYTFSDVARGLGYPKRIEGKGDTLQLLAKMQLPIYITTSHHDFLQKAIIDNKRTPRTQICFWGEEPVTIAPEHRTDYDYRPTVENPLVYHIFGLEQYPTSMVLNEDDYLDFLSAISKDVDQQRPKIPIYLRKALTKNSLILLGYRLKDWDFRVLFRGLINATPSTLRLFNLAIQLDPRQQSQSVSAEQVRKYLEKYFSDSNFTVEWGNAHGFVERMWQELDAWRRR
ncbi:MAG: SIR2 family protein [Chloroflexota bacterium]